MGSYLGMRAVSRNLRPSACVNFRKGLEPIYHVLRGRESFFHYSLDTSNPAGKYRVFTAHLVVSANLKPSFCVFWSAITQRPIMWHGKDGSQRECCPCLPKKIHMHVYMHKALDYNFVCVAVSFHILSFSEKLHFWRWLLWWTYGQRQSRSAKWIENNKRQMGCRYFRFPLQLLMPGGSIYVHHPKN